MLWYSGDSLEAVIGVGGGHGGDGGGHGGGGGWGGGGGHAFIGGGGHGWGGGGVSHFSAGHVIVAGCNEEAGEVTGWPIDQIQAALEPDQRQSQLLDDLGNAVVKASDEIRSHCQADIAFTPTGRLDQMHDRVASLVDGVNTVSPALAATPRSNFIQRTFMCARP